MTTANHAPDCCVCDDLGPCEFCPHVVACRHDDRRPCATVPGRVFCGCCGLILEDRPADDVTPVFVGAGWFS